MLIHGFMKKSLLEMSEYLCHVMIKIMELALEKEKTHSNVKCDVSIRPAIFTIYAYCD